MIKQANMSIQLIDSMGSDINVVNAARVSFAKEILEFKPESELGLLNYLAKHDHWSPFAHTCISIRCKVPLWLARQLVKHQVGGNWNEESRRYISDTPEYWFPVELHNAPTNAKQGSGEVHPLSDMWIDHMVEHTENAHAMYTQMIEDKIAPEEARYILPLNTMTNFVWTGSLLFFTRVIRQRQDGHAQLGAQEFAALADKIVRPIYPHSYTALMGVK
jgi:thymidylate synthase (FAD)